jgi:hypothetical protein
LSDAYAKRISLPNSIESVFFIHCIVFRIVLN